ncbi:MAG: transcriptional regulator [Firmicutes bacterium]|nr:transcriptional regulator [Bacillota bacterium]
MKYYEQFVQLGLFTYADAKKVIGTESATVNLLQTYIQKGYLAKIRRGLYTAINFVDQEPVTNKFAIASALTNTAVVSHHSAFEYYGYSNQVSYDICVSSESKFNSFDFAGFHYHRVKPDISDGVIDEAGGVAVTDIERTVLDGISDFENDMGFEELMKCIPAVPFLNEDKLISYLSQYNKCFLYQKTGFILEHLQSELSISDALIQHCKEQSGNSSRYLIKNTPKEILDFNNKWHLTIPQNLWQNVNGSDLYADV